jgi:hypothetical protein
LFIEEARTYDAHEHLRGNVLLISDFAIAEFSSGVAIGLVGGSIRGYGHRTRSTLQSLSAVKPTCSRSMGRWRDAHVPWV